MVLITSLAAVFAVDSISIVVRGRWVLMQDGQPAPSDDFQRGLQTSGLAWDGKVLWSVGDQRSTFPGHLYAIDPQSGRLDRAPIPLVTSDPAIQARLDAWSRLDMEDIAILSLRERRFVIVLEDKATAALVVQLDERQEVATVCAVWEFHFPDGATPIPYRNDPNYRLEGIAIDELESRGYVAFERDVQGIPHLYQFNLSSQPLSGIAQVSLDPLPFADWNRLQGKPGTLVNANGLQFVRTNAGEPRLFVLCRDREMFFVLDPKSGLLIGQVILSLRSPEGEAIEWVSPEGIAVDTKRGVAYIITDPDSTDGNYRLRSTPRATGRFAEFVPLLFELNVPAELIR
jgi:uncharacterized protein YjiK